MSIEHKASKQSKLKLGKILITSQPKKNWGLGDVSYIYDLPMNDLLYTAQWVHRQNFDPNTVQISTLLSIKTGGCPEDCSYCPQSIRYDTGVEAESLMSLEDVRKAAVEAKAAGATRFCMGAAYRGPKDKQLDKIAQMIAEVKDMGMETCATLGLLNESQAQKLADIGLDFYNHNLDTSESYYSKIITTRSYSDRLLTIKHVREAGIKVCCGGIVGMGESRLDRISLMHTLSTLEPQPESVPINQLVPIPGTPLAKRGAVDGLEFVRTIAVARILMPKSHVRLSAGRGEFTNELQALCFAAGANSIFYGDVLLTTDNPEHESDQALFSKLGLKPEEIQYSV
ncbi:MAG: biotin synthase BioB [Rhodospirillaceae bacterium]|nr:biotin synthase BioB [Rhodospirillaceae bacterium]